MEYFVQSVFLKRNGIFEKEMYILRRKANEKKSFDTSQRIFCNSSYFSFFFGMNLKANILKLSFTA